MRINDIKKDIIFLEESLRRVTAELDKLKSKAPDGVSLRAVKHGNKYQYFLREHGKKTNGKYITRKNQNIAVVLAQIEYDIKLIKKLQEELNYLKGLETIWDDDPFMFVESQMTLAKRALINVPRISDEKYLHEWQNQEYKRLAFKEEIPEYYTRQGLRVRSKTEVIIADILDELGVPFLYEKPLKLGAAIVHPDFTLLKIKKRKEIYWEHFGMMDDAEYRNNALSKIRKYEANDLYQYDSVIWTFETERSPINTKCIRKMIKELKDKLGY